MAPRRRRAARLSPAALLAGAALLSACAVGGALPEGAAGPEAPARAAEPAPTEAIALPASDGTPLPTSRWLPEGETRAVILALHGFGDYGASTFTAAATAWAAAGIATYAPDQRGFGRGETRGRWPGADALVADAVSLAASVCARHPGRPLIVLGHSMGGGIALAAAAQGLAADRLVLAAPAIWGGDALNPVHRFAAWTAAAVAPERRFSGRGLVRIQASDNIEALRALGRDPLYLAPPSARELLGLVRIVDRAAAAAEETRQPALLLLGAKDEILPEARVRDVFARLPGPQREIRYPDGWHLLFRDLQAERVWLDVAAYALEETATARACAAPRLAASAG
ncbi:MAG: alpha/beta fold hydrolase [Pseudomonadota bacterium]